jgi:hypothetical protein
MNYTRLALAAVVAWVVSVVYSFAVARWVLFDRIADYPGVFRTAAAVNANLPLWLLGLLLTMLAVAYIYAKGCQPATRTLSGLGLGSLLGVVSVGATISEYVSFNIGRRLAAETAAAAFLEAVIIGVTVGAVYKRA